MPGIQFDALPDEDTLAATVEALERHGVGVEVVDDLASARETVLARIPQGASVLTNRSVTLDETGITDAIDHSGQYKSVRTTLGLPDAVSHAQETRSLAGQPQYALGSVHAITQDGIMLVASATGSQLGSLAWGATNVILVSGSQKVVPDLTTARRRLFEHSLTLENARVQVVYGEHSHIGKLLEIRQELPGRIHLVLIRQLVGY